MTDGLKPVNLQLKSRIIEKALMDAITFSAAVA